MVYFFLYSLFLGIIQRRVVRSLTLASVDSLNRPVMSTRKVQYPLRRLFEDNPVHLLILKCQTTFFMLSFVIK